MERFQVTAEVLNVRSGPGRAFEVLTRILRGMVVTATGEAERGWLPVASRLRDGDVEGWVSSQYLDKDLGAPDGTPPWLEVARREIGIREFPGADQNPRIVEYHKATTLRATEDEVPWCSSFVNWCMQQSGQQGTGSASARSWLAWGERIEQPRTGCVAVFRRGQDPTMGHVAFFLRDRGAFLEVLGGNQSNQVKVSSYPSERLLDFRWSSP